MKFRFGHCLVTKVYEYVLINSETDIIRNTFPSFKNESKVNGKAKDKLASGSHPSAVSWVFRGLSKLPSILTASGVINRAYNRICLLPARTFIKKRGSIPSTKDDVGTECSTLGTLLCIAPLSPRARAIREGKINFHAIMI